MNMETIFKPKNMAVIGVSTTNDDHPANVIFQKNHLRQRVKVFGVNSRGGKLRGEELYRSVLDIPDRLDLAVIATRAEFVPKLATHLFGEPGTLETTAHLASEWFRRYLLPPATGVTE